MWECNAKHPCKEGVERRAASSRSHAPAGSEIPLFRHKICEIKATAEMVWDNYQDADNKMLIYELTELHRITAEAILLYQNTEHTDTSR